MIYSCFPPFDQAQDGFVCVFGLFLLNQERKMGKEREMGERERERKVLGKRETGKTKGNRK